MSGNTSRLHLRSQGSYWAQIQWKYKHKFIFKDGYKAKSAGTFFMVPAVILRDTFKLNPVYSIQTAWILLEFCSVPEAQTIRQKMPSDTKKKSTSPPVLLCPPDFGRSKSLEEYYRSWTYRKLTTVSSPVHRTPGRFRLEGASGGVIQPPPQSNASSAADEGTRGLSTWVLKTFRGCGACTTPLVTCSSAWLPSLWKRFSNWLKAL